MKSVLLTLFFAVCALMAGAIDLTFSVVNPTCNGFTNGTATVTATGGTAPYAYAWSNGQSGQTALGIGAGVYTVTVTDQAGVTASGTIELMQPAALALTFSQASPNCNGIFAPVTAHVSGGLSPYSYSWSTGAITPEITPIAAGNVFVTVTDFAGCSVINTYFVPEPSQIFTSYFALAPKCAGGTDGSATPTVIGNYLPHTWVWSTGTSANAALTNVPNGTYSITITDAQGCTRADEVLVPTQAPVGVLPLMTNVRCYGTLSGTGSAIGSGGVNPYAYMWSTGSTEQVIQNLGIGTYTVTLTDGNNCSVSATAIVTQPDSLTNTIISITPACGNNGGATVQPSGGTPPYNIIWNNGQFYGPTITGVPAGVYYVCTFDVNGCQRDLSVEIPGSPGLNVNLVTEKASCTGVNDGTATALVTGGSGSYIYSWSNGAPPVASLNGLPAGLTLTVTVTDQVSGCTGTASTVIATHHQLVTQVVDTDIICANDPSGTATVSVLNGTAPFTFVWSVNGAPVSGPTITNLPAGAYPVTITDAVGCTAINVADIGASGAVDAAFTLETVYCDSTNVKILLSEEAQSTGGPIVSWQWVAAWETGAVQFDVQNPPLLEVPANSTGNVQLTVTTALGCTDMFVVPFEVGKQPIVSISANTPLINCDGGPVPVSIVGDSSYVYSWTPTTGLTFVNNNPQEVLANPAASTIYQLIANDGGCKDTLTVDIKKNVPFEVSLPGTSIESCDTLQALTATLNVPNSGFDIDWLNAAGDSIATGNTITVPASNSATVYTVIVRDEFGCSETAQASVIGIGVAVEANILSVAEACENAPIVAGVINLHPNDTLTYAWSAVPAGLTLSDPGAANPTITGAAGNYIISVLVTNQYGCEKLLSAPVKINAAGTLQNSIKNDLCDGLSVDFENNSSITGVWAFGDGDTSILNNPAHLYGSAGTYIVTFTPDDICFEPFYDTIEVSPVPAIVAEIESDLVACLGAATFGFTDSTAHTAQIATWEWTIGTQTSILQNPQVIFTQEGTVTATLVVTDINGCRDTSDAVTINIDFVNDFVPSTAKLCVGGTVSLNADTTLGNYEYVWTSNPPDPGLNGSIANPVVSPEVPTLYNVEITNGNCTVTQTVAVSINEPANLWASNDSIVCEDDLVTISANSTNAVSYEWSRTRGFSEIYAQTPTVNVSPITSPMNYVRVTTIDGCPAIDSVMLQFAGTDLSPAPEITYICNGVNGTLNVLNNNASDILTFNWSNGLPSIANPTVNPTIATTFSVEVTNQFGCKDTLNFFVAPANLNLQINVTANDTIVPGESALLNATVSGGQTYTYEWSPDATLNANNIQSPLATPVENTTYTVLATDIASGCTVQGDVLIVLFSPECTDPYTFVPNAFSPNNDGNNDYFRVRGFGMTELYFAVWDRWGEKVYETTDINHQGWNGYVKDQPATPDAYAWMARVVCGNGTVWKAQGNVTLLR